MKVSSQPTFRGMSGMYVLISSTVRHILARSIQPMPFFAKRSVFIRSSPSIMFGSISASSMSGTRFLKISSAALGFSITSYQP